MERKRFARLSQRLGALLLAGVTLWTVYATAGSVDAAGAWMAVKRELPLALLQWQLGDIKIKRYGKRKSFYSTESVYQNR